MTKKKTKLQEPVNPPLFIASVSDSINTLIGKSYSGANSSVTTKINGWFSDNYRTYYIDNSSKKHIQNFNEHGKNLNISDVINSLTLEDITKIVNAFTDFNVTIDMVKEEIELNYL